MLAWKVLSAADPVLALDLQRAVDNDLLSAVLHDNAIERSFPLPAQKAVDLMVLHDADCLAAIED